MSATHQTNADAAPATDAEERAAITAWIEKAIGGRVTKIERLRRWRAIWRAWVKDDKGERSYMVKGVRPWDSIPYSLKHEMLTMEVLAKNGIPVPHIYGMMEFPEAFVMDWVEADGRDGALVQESIEHASTITPNRWAASLKYMEQLVLIHKIPVDQFKHTEAVFTKNAYDIAMTHYDLNMDMLEEANALDAMMQFFTVWLRRNVPQHRTTPTFVTGDCGQFLNEGPEIATIIDLEIGHISDAMNDLACFRGRHPVENMGDVHELFRHYARSGGQPLDVRVIGFHTVVFLGMALVGPILALHKKHSGGDWVEGVMQLAFIGRRTVEALAEVAGVPLEENIRLPEPHLSPLVDMAMDKLESELKHLPTSDAFAPWQRGILVSLPQYLRAQAHYGRWMEEEDLSEIGALLGKRPANLIEADKVLKAFVEKAGPDQDAALIKLFYRRLLRMCLSFAGPGAPKTHLMFMKVEPIIGKME
jgi:aminoglycoside phosphotransferase (APT) family kinase protein